MPIYTSLTAAYAKAIYIDGTKRFSEIRAEYVEPVKQYAAANYTREQIDTAHNNLWISDLEYEQTLAYIAV